MDSELWDKVNERFRHGDIAGTVKWLEGFLSQEATDRFKGLIGVAFSAPPREVLASINGFIESCTAKFDIQAVYLEMNGFDINYHGWYFDFFGYSKYGADPNDLEWLCYWDSDNWSEFKLLGLEAVQADFAWYHQNHIYNSGKEYEKTYDLAVLLVMTKFVALIESAIRAGELSKAIPILATAHEFDIVGRFEPKAAK